MAKKLYKSGLQEEGVKSMLALIEQEFSDKSEKDTENKAINELYQQAFRVETLTPPQYLGAKKLHQAIWKTISRTKPLDFELHCVPMVDGKYVQVDPDFESVVTEGFSTVLDRGDYAGSFRNKGGVIFNALLYGDGFRMIGARGEGKFPVEFIPIQNDNLYVSKQATGFRRGNKPVKRAAAIFSGTHEEFEALFPELAKKKPFGKIPRTKLEYENLTQTARQRMEEENIIEWAYYWQIDSNEPVYRMVAGCQCIIGEMKDGKEYPNKFKNEEGSEELYIPVSQRVCIPATEGFYNEGLGSVLYDLCTVDRRIKNMMLGHIEKNIYPLTMVGIPEGQQAAFTQLVNIAYELRNQGLDPLVPVTYDSKNPQLPNAVQPILNQGRIDEGITFSDLIDLEFKRIGVHLDEPENRDATATQVLADIENATAFVAQMGEYNASETKFELYAALDIFKNKIKSGNKTPLNLRTFSYSEGVRQELKGFTLGDLADAFKKYHYFFTLNVRSGVVPSNTAKRAKMLNAASYFPDGSAEKAAIGRQLAAVDGVELPSNAPQPTGEEQPIPNETARAVPVPGANNPLQQI